MKPWEVWRDGRGRDIFKMNGLLKFTTCGSVDDGKSTLIGHMLYEAKLLFTDQKRALELDSRVGSRGGKIDYSLLLDGLMAEREQGITIDVAYRFFSTGKRSFIVADSPGHEEYTRNMAVGASFAELAVILVDAARGIMVQTRRHARICAFMGIRYFIFVINKMDLMHYSQRDYKKIEKDVKKLAVDLDLANVYVIPVSATEGDNITVKSDNMPWYQGKTLLDYLENVDVAAEEESQGFTMPVQRVCRPDRTFRGFQGQVESGNIYEGDKIRVLPSGETANIESIFVLDRQEATAQKGQCVTISLNREIDISRGCVLEKDAGLIVGTMFTATLLWMDEERLIEGRNFLLKIGTRKLPASVMKIKYRIDVNTGEQSAVSKLYKNEIGVCDIVLSSPVVYDTFRRHKGLGEFILIDRVTNMTSACGVVEHPLRRSENIIWQNTDITRSIRSAMMEQKPLTIWFTGLSGAGKSVLANEVEKRLSAGGKYTMLLDGDNIRMGLNKNLGFEPEDRIENIRRIAEVAKLMNDAGLIVLTAFISPFRCDRQNARDIIGTESFVEIYVSTPLEECERRDVKGLYQKAREGKIPNFTGISSPYESPERADIVVDTGKKALDEAVDYIVERLEKYIK